MSSLFRRVRKVDGKKVKDERYTIRYCLDDGTWKMERAYWDKEASPALLTDRERAVARREVSLVDRYAEYRKMPLLEHLKAFRDSVEAGGATLQYVKKIETRIRQALITMGARTFKDLTAAAAEQFILHLRDKKQSTATIDHYTDVLREFSRWGFKRERWPTDSLAGLRRIEGEHDIRRERRALTEDEGRRLVAAARTRAVDNYLETHPKALGSRLAQMRLQGENRAVAYQLGLLAGLRFNEIKTLVWGDFNFDRAPARLTIRAKNAKSKREDSRGVKKCLPRVRKVYGYRRRRILRPVATS